jgi:hypothetical protein
MADRGGLALQSSFMRLARRVALIAMMQRRLLAID